MVREKTVAVSGYFDPLHVGHLEYFALARELAGPDGRLVVIVNNDEQARQKKGYSFMPEQDRVRLVGALRLVDEAVLSVDTDRTVCESLRRVEPDVFANGGDRHNEEIPEAQTCRELGVRIVDGLGEKIRSSSGLVARQRARAAS